MPRSLPDILKEVRVMEGECKNFRLDLIKMCWYMRGSMTLDEAFQTAHEDREIISKMIKENLETTKKSGLPFF